MSTIIESGGVQATWNKNENKWKSRSQSFQDLLNDWYDEEAPSGPATPFLAGVAVEIAKKHLKDVEVIQLDKSPESDSDKIY